MKWMKHIFQQYCSWPVCLHAYNSNIHFCALGQKPLWNWKRDLSVKLGEKVLFCYVRTVDAKNSFSRAKRKSAYQKTVLASSRYLGFSPGLMICGFQRKQFLSSGFMTSFHADRRRVLTPFLIFLGAPSLWMSSPSANAVFLVTVPSPLLLCWQNKAADAPLNVEFHVVQFPDSWLLMSLSSINERWHIQAFR